MSDAQVHEQWYESKERDKSWQLSAGAELGSGEDNTEKWKLQVRAAPRPFPASVNVPPRDCSGPQSHLALCRTPVSPNREDWLRDMLFGATQHSGWRPRSCAAHDWLLGCLIAKENTQKQKAVGQRQKGSEDGYSEAATMKAELEDNVQVLRELLAESQRAQAVAKAAQAQCEKDLADAVRERERIQKAMLTREGGGRTHNKVATEASEAQIEQVLQGSKADRVVRDRETTGACELHVDVDVDRQREIQNARQAVFEETLQTCRKEFMRAMRKVPLPLFHPKES